MKSVLLKAYLKPSGTLSFVEFTDGTVGIVQDDQPLAGCRWGADELEQGMTAFHRMRKMAAEAEMAQQPQAQG